jgi:hypothetical protein
LWLLGTILCHNATIATPTASAEHAFHTADVAGVGFLSLDQFCLAIKEHM